MKILRSMSLKNKAAFFIAAILVAVIGLSTLFLSMTMVPRFRKALLLSASLVGEGLVKDIKKTVDMGIPLASLDGLGDKLTETVKQYPDLGYICVTDDQGVILYRSQQMGDSLGSRLGTVIGASEVSPGSAPLVRIGGTGFYDVAMPIASGEGTVGSVHVGLKSQVVSSQVNAVLYPSMGIGLVSFLLATVLIVTFVNRFISAPLEGLSVTARKISHGDLASPPTVARRDEIGQLAEAFTVMVGSLSDIIGQSRSTSNSMEKSAAELAQIVGNLTDAFGRQVAKLDEVGLSISEMDSLARNLTEQSRNLSQSAVESSSSVMETMSAIGEINHNMSEITSAVENISSSMLEMSTTIRQVAAGAESMASMAEETRAAVSRINDGIQNMRQTADKSRVLSEDVKKNALEGGSRAVRETLKGIVSIQEDVRQAENAMKTLQDRASSISEIISVIDDIADQTNLLALNASIIAAQAGDQGRSFAVVAQEIRDLSVRTSESTRKISALIKGVQQEAAHSSASQARVIESVQKGLKLGQEAEKSLELITGSADESAKMAGLIAKVTGEQAEASQRVSDSVAVFSRSAEEIKKATREEAKTSEFIKDAMEKTKRMIEMVNRATEEQNRGSRLLAESSEKAKEISQEVLTATDMERQLAGSIAGAVAALKEISHQNLQLVKTISVSSELLTGLSASLRKELDKFSTGEA